MSLTSENMLKLMAYADGELEGPELEDAQKLLDDSIENNYAIQMADELLVSELRRNLSAQQTVRVLVLLSATEPEASAPALTGGRCDPFKQMHRCP